MRNTMRLATMAGTGLWVGLFTATLAMAQGDLPTHAPLRTVAMASAVEGLPALPAQGDGAQNEASKDDLFAGTEIFAKNATGVNEITMDPDSLELVGGPDRHRAHNMVLNVVRTYSYDKPGMYNMADVDAFRNKLSGGDWHCSVHTRDLKNGSSTDVCSKHRTDGMRESAIISVEPKSLTFIHQISKPGAGPESEMGVFPMLYGAPGLPAIAMLNPDAMIRLQLALHGVPGELGLPGELGGLGPLGMIHAMPRLNPEQMVRPLEDMQKKLNSPEMKERMKNFQLKMKDLQNSPEMKQHLDELNKQPHHEAQPNEM